MFNCGKKNHFCFEKEKYRTANSKMDEINNWRIAPFDFNSDFTAAENHIINGILMQPFETFVSNGFPDIDLDALLNPNVLNLNDSSSDGGNRNVMPVIDRPDSETITGNGDVIMSWTNVMESEPMPPSNYHFDAIENDIIEDLSNEPEPPSYQELETFDVPKLYDNLQSTFGLNHLKEIDTNLNYPALKVECDQSDSINHPSSPAIIPHEYKWKTFLMPIQCDMPQTSSIQEIRAKLQERPDIVFSIIRMRTQHDQANETKILLVAPPKQTKRPSKRYIPVSEQLARIGDERILVPCIDSVKKPRVRKTPVKLNSPEETQAQVIFALGPADYDVINERSVEQKIAMKAPKMYAVAPKARAKETKKLVEIQFGDIRTRRRSTRQPKQTRN